MVVQNELRTAMETSREDLIEVLAQYQAVPVVDDGQEVSSLLGGRTNTEFKLEEPGGVETTDRQTRQEVLEHLGVEDEQDLEPVQEEIKNHQAWGEKV
ncbi:hypothetical protein HTSR_1757 [Halodesulfurarchaeum formicicum]|uniref:Uncharacterized protein n=1 Tax=Halodesulfurarchaeum formicicum TaxID=1873524 RepID=A0A1D8S6D8_9EURY|nr:hypothetical protein [Halodesulfurarchaeum formicicum]AOW80926.1 hypothetical protein HTSR_1757 [Halodesulfurarchaeum formicicum]APE96259.1 hypothetical protein HSR6_1823 [Halodesulfurarchaeum formicicum]